MGEAEDAHPFVTVAPGQRLAVRDDFVLVHLCTVVGAPMANALLQHGKQHGAGGKQLALLYFIERGGIGAPDAAAREAWIELSRTSGPYYAASTFVVPQDGTAAGAAHAFVQDVRENSGGRLPLAIFSSVRSALGWLRQAVPASTRLPSDDVIEQMLDRLRATA